MVFVLQNTHTIMVWIQGHTSLLTSQNMFNMFQLRLLVLCKSLTLTAQFYEA